MVLEPLSLITVDSRVGSAEVFPHFRSGIAKLGHLEFADFAFTGRGPLGVPVPIGVERKRIPDLVQSMKTGRLAEHQLPGLLEHYGEVWVIVEGRYRANPKTGILQIYQKRRNVLGLDVRKTRTAARDLIAGTEVVTESAVEGYMITLSTQAAVRVMKTDGPKETARFVERLWNWWAKPWEGHRSLAAMHEIQLRKNATPVERVAAVIPGVGPLRARKVADRFATVHEMVGAKPADWLGIDGIGKGTLKSVEEFLRGQ